MNKRWCVLSCLVSVVLLVLFLWTLRLYNQASSNQALWAKVIKCFDEGPSKEPPNKKCPGCPSSIVGFVSTKGEFKDSTSTDISSAHYKIRQSITKNDSAGIIVFSVTIHKIK